MKTNFADPKTITIARLENLYTFRIVDAMHFLGNLSVIMTIIILLFMRHVIYAMTNS